MKYSDKLSGCLCSAGEVHTIHKGGSHINLKEF